MKAICWDFTSVYFNLQRFQPFRAALPLLVEIWASRSPAFSGMSLYGIGLAVNGKFQKWKHWDHSTCHLDRKCFYWKSKLDVVRKGVCFLFRIVGVFISLARPSCVYEKKNPGNRKWQEVFVLFKNLHAQRKVAFAFSTLLLYGPLLIYIGTAPISEVSIASTWEYGDQLGFCSFVLLLSGVASTAGIFALP